VRGQSSLRAAFLERNARLREELEHIEAKLRRRDLLASDDALIDFYLERIPADVASTRAFERWWRRYEHSHPHRLDVPAGVLLADALPPLAASDYPPHLEVDGNPLPLTYRFDPTHADDGVTVDVPLPLLASFPARRADWLVPGYLHDKLVAVLRGMPKDLRRTLVPIPETAARLREALSPFAEGDFFERLADLVTAASGVRVPARQLAAVPLAPWLRVNLRILDHAGREIAHGRDLEVLRRELRTDTIRALRPAAAQAWEREGLRRWDFGDLPEELQVPSGGVSLRLFPGLEDESSTVRLRLFPGAADARRATRKGVVRLAALALPQQHDLVLRRCATDRELALLAAAAGFDRGLFGQIADRAVAESLQLEHGDPPRSQSDFAARLDAARPEVAARGEEVARTVRAVLLALKDARAELDGLSGPAFADGRAAIGRQLDALLEPGWVRDTPDPAFGQLPKYLRAAARRAQRLRDDVARDRRLEGEVAPFDLAWRGLVARAAPAPPGPELVRLRWMIEEFRLSLFAQDLRTLAPVSAKRLEAQLARARAEAAGG
jgi:ATP-dependent helicase HrpA